VLAGALVAVAVAALGASAWSVMRNTAARFDLGDVAGIVQLTDGKAAGPSMTATLADARWETMSADERKGVVSQLLDIEEPKGIRALALLDTHGRMRASATVGPEGRTIVVP
jgi:hypothetical protein